MADNILIDIEGLNYLLPQITATNAGEIPIISGDIIVPPVEGFLWGCIKGDIANQEDLQVALTHLQDQINDIIGGSIGSLFHYKGSVATYADLPLNPSLGMFIM